MYPLDSCLGGCLTCCMKRTRATAVALWRIGKSVEIESLTGADGDWLGLGEIRAGGVALRSGTRAWTPRLSTPNGIIYQRFEAAGLKRLPGGGLEARFRAIGWPWVHQEFCDEYSQPLLHLPAKLQPVEDHFSLHIEPLSRELGGRVWTGFSIALGFQSRSRGIRRMIVDATWELGGAMSGNTVLNQSQCSPPVFRSSLQNAFTSACLKRIDEADSPQGVSYQLAPRGGMLQAFDFQHGPAGALLHYWPALDSINSFLAKPRGRNLLHVVDEYRFPLARRVSTTPQHILFLSGPLPEHTARDLWWSAYEEANGAVRQRRRIKPTIVMPEVDPPRSGRVQDGRVQLRIGEEWVDAPEALYAMADRLLPKLAAAGVRRLMNPLVQESDVTVMGLKRKLDSGLDGDLFCGSLCATHRFLPAEFWGGMKAWRHLARAGQALGIEMGHWFAPHMSPRAAIFQQHPDWLMTGSHSLTFGGGYWNILASLDWTTRARDWILSDLQCWHDEGGLDYLFVDSWPNLGLLPVNHATGGRTNQAALERFFAALQKIGIRSFSFEGISCLGISRMSVADLRGDKEDGLPGVVGQNDFGWWRHQLDMAYNLNIHLSARGRSDEEQEQMVFSAMAARGGLILPKQTGGGKCPAWLSRLQHIYNRVSPEMQRRNMLPERNGIAWSVGRVKTIWSFKSQRISVPAGVSVFRVEENALIPLKSEETLSLDAWQVYRIIPS